MIATQFNDNGVLNIILKPKKKIELLATVIIVRKPENVEVEK